MIYEKEFTNIDKTFSIFKTEGPKELIKLRMIDSRGNGKELAFTEDEFTAYIKFSIEALSSIGEGNA